MVPKGIVQNFFPSVSSDKRILAIIIIVAAATIVDSSLINIFRLTDINPSADWSIGLFMSLLAICGWGQFVILRHVRQRSKEGKDKSILRIKVAFAIVPVTQGILTGIFVLIVFQVLVTSYYTINLIIAAVSISYVTGICMLGLLAHRFISWFKSSRNVVVLFYGLSSVALALNMVLTFVIAISLLRVLTPEISGGLIVGGGGAPLFSDVGELVNTLSPAFIISSILSFIITWIATSMLLRHYSRKFGKMKYWIIMGLPLVYFSSQFLSLSLNFLSSLQASNPVFWSTVLTLAFTLTKPVGGILFGIAFWVITKNIHKDSLVRNYMLISGSGLVLLFASNQAIALTAAAYPPFGLASISLVGYSCYLILVGIYFAAISLSEDSSLRQSIRNFAIGQSKLLDSIGTAQMEQEIQRRVVVLVKQNQRKMVEESGVESSLTDEEIRQYLAEVITEVKKAKAK